MLVTPSLASHRLGKKLYQGLFRRIVTIAYCRKLVIVIVDSQDIINMILIIVLDAYFLSRLNDQKGMGLKCKAMVNIATEAAGLDK